LFRDYQMNGLIIDIDDVTDINECKEELETLHCAKIKYKN